MRAASTRTFAVPDALEQIDQTLAALWTAHPHVPEVIRIRVGIAVTEVAANIIEHATKGLDRLVNVHVQAHVRDRDVMITFIDDGIPAATGYFTHMHAFAMPDDFAESGRGLPLAQAALSELDYQRMDELNHWTLVSEAF